MLNFIHHGKIGELQVGDSRAEVEAKLGLPEDWKGKTGLFGPRVHTPYEAEGWLFYDSTVGLQFDELGVSTEISITFMPGEPSQIVVGHHPFEDWPLSKNPIMGEVKEYLISNRIPLEESSEEDDYFLVDKLCVVECFPYQCGKRLELRRRQVSMLSRVLRPEYLPSYVKR